MDVVCASEIDETEYVRFLDGFAGAPGVALGYHYPFYLRFLVEVVYPGSALRFIAAREGGRLAGVMPAVHLRTAALNVWLSLAYFGPNAGALVREDNAAAADTVAAMTRAAEADARRLECGSLTIYTPLHADTAVYTRALAPVDFEVPRTAQCMTLPADPEQSPWPRKVRYDVRRAAALGVVIRRMASERELEVAWEIYRSSCETLTIPVKPLHHLRSLYRTAGDHGVLLVAEHEGEIVEILIAFIGGGVLSYYLPCTRPDKRALQPGLALLDRAVAVGREAGCRLLNFEASPSTDSSVYRFKERCGGEPVEYRVLVKLLRPGVLDQYRALSREGLMAAAPQAFVVPFEALT